MLVAALFQLPENLLGARLPNIIYILADDLGFGDLSCYGQKTMAEASMKEAASLFARPIVTKIEKIDIFYPAEDYHQDYFKKNPTAGYCNFVIRPKLKKFKQYLQK